LYVVGFVAVRKRGEKRQRNVDGASSSAEKVTILTVLMRVKIAYLVKKLNYEQSLH